MSMLPIPSLLSTAHTIVRDLPSHFWSIMRLLGILRCIRGFVSHCIITYLYESHAGSSLFGGLIVWPLDGDS